MKTVNINSTIHDLINTHPEIKDIMKSLGFVDITNPLMLKTVGRAMTIKKGAALKKIDIEIIKNKFLENEYLLEDK